MKLPTVSVEVVEEDGTVTGFRLSQPALTADPMKRADVQRTISLLYAYSDVMTELLKIAAPVTARNIANDERMALEEVGR